MSPRRPTTDEWKTRIVAAVILTAIVSLCGWAIAGVHSLEVRQEGTERDTEYLKKGVDRVERKLDRLLEKFPR